MNPEHTDPQNGPPASPQKDAVSPDSQAECERLRQEVQRLAAELAEVREERDDYRKTVYEWAHACFTDEELKNSIPDEKDCVPLEAFIDDLERIVRGS